MTFLSTAMIGNVALESARQCTFASGFTTLSNVELIMVGRTGAEPLPMTHLLGFYSFLLGCPIFIFILVFDRPAHGILDLPTIFIRVSVCPGMIQ